MYPTARVTPARSKPATSRTALMDRVRRLESMLVPLINPASPEIGTRSAVGVLPGVSGLSPGPLADFDPTQSQDLPGPGSMRVNSEETVYFSSAHWSAILEKISELQDYIQYRDQDETPASPAGTPGSASSVAQPTSEGPGLFAGFIPAASKAELVGAIPDRTVANRLIHRYFNLFPLSRSNTSLGSLRK